ncbi:MAG TPA: hypothetical protein ENJ79_00775, partial [Gammaproteobacteria bacterium]|nr:hypothetical protein [Gammaproteobacteria bacterium]
MAVDFLCTLLSHPQPRDSGDYLHRVAWPGRALGELTAVEAVQTTHPQALQKALHADLLVIHMVADASMQILMEQRQAAGRPTVFEISDDFCNFPEHLPGAAFYADAGVQALIRQLAASADAVQFSSPFLAQKYADLNPVRQVFPNQLEHAPDPDPPPTGTHHPALGWAGSIGHLDEARALADMLSRWRGRARYRFHVMAAPEIVRVFRQAGLQVETETTGDMRQYLRFLDRLDIGIAIANRDDFSAGRSDGKFIEYASRGVVAVCSAGAPYADSVRDGETGFLFSDESNLHAILDRLTQEPALRQRIRQQALDYLRRERTHAAAAGERLAFYQERLERTGDISLATCMEHRSPGYTECIDPIETELLQAMLLHRDGQPGPALECYTRLAEREPAFHLLWERMGQACAALGAAEQAAECRLRAQSLLARSLSIIPS